ncbi:MAG: putative selenate reductase subunit YgfK [Desulfobacterales bacterium]|nr:putative selenate reductase subunit YgfK [Desulfobacterales bacterium]
MSDEFSCCPIDKLMEWILVEERKGCIFGVGKGLFFTPDREDPFRMERYGQMLETPVGVAAGPHTQMTQNIVSAWLTGARYFELKTVQTLDELQITRPCINMEDEGYNCEWSQELKLDHSFNEYLKAWILLHALRDKFGWGDGDGPGFIFNMSVGYNMEGILNPNVQHFLDRMADCKEEKAGEIQRLSKIYPRILDLEIPDRISNNITISTMHGCPPEEVEKIGRYFIRERKLETTIKLNPTLLGPERLRGILNDSLGFDVSAPDQAFEHDLKYEDAKALIGNLLRKAKEVGVRFNLKLTNTLEVLNKKEVLPGSEEMVYMSGRALHPISVNLAERLQTDFNGELDLSFSAGVDCFNAADVIACNLKPVTVCSDILKPGGYGRIKQYLDELKKSFSDLGAGSIREFILARARQEADVPGAAYANLRAYAGKTVREGGFQKERFPHENIKTNRELTFFDCASAPCAHTCPANQDVPGYMYYTARGDYGKALQIILRDNPFPNMQGMVCDHKCQGKCTRINYDNPLRIRDVKRFIASRRPASAPPPERAPANGMKTAVIGAGPSGLACAYFLALAGFEVDVHEAGDCPGGMASACIPMFRLDDESIRKDVAAIEALGVRLHYGEKIDAARFGELKERHDYLYIGVGAQKAVTLGVPGDDARGVYDQLQFLRRVRMDAPMKSGKNVLVIGGGNAAMDAARAARRLAGLGVDESGPGVRVVYRRTRKEMPADAEEIQAALEEGVQLMELAAPRRLVLENGRVKALVCTRMKLVGNEAGGRPKPVEIEDSEFTLDADVVISAIGQRVEADFFPGGELRIDPDTRETSLANVFAGGDATRGASTLIRAIADGKHAAESIINRAAREGKTTPKSPGDHRESEDLDQLLKARAFRQYGEKPGEIGLDRRTDFALVSLPMDEATARAEAARCLQCDLFCGICVTVCPNRANVLYTIAPARYKIQCARLKGAEIEIEDLETIHLKQRLQVLNVGNFCNQCGNCVTFCPTSGSPFRDKPTFYFDKETFDAEKNGYYFDESAITAKTDGEEEILRLQDDLLVHETRDVRAELDARTLEIKKASFKNKGRESYDTRRAVELAVLLTSLRNW